MLNFDNVKIPKKINRCPIAEAVVELRFESSIPAEVIMSKIFNKLGSEYPQFEKLPITEIPTIIRDAQINLKFSPHYRLSNENFIIQFGPRSFSIVCQKEYKGWSEYFKKIEHAFNEIKNLNIIDSPSRFGLRYINFFEKENIFEKIKVGMSLANNSLLEQKNVFRSEFNMDEFVCVVQITNNALLQNKINGSSIDIDIIIDKDDRILRDFVQLTLKAHDIERKIFFGILQEDFLSKLEPEF
jgi:uncharacterized protein (TIGR04255 family)